MARYPIDWAQFSQIIADTPARIRRCDVYRFLDEANETGAGVEDAATWLRSARPDLDDEITTCINDSAGAR